MYTFIHTEGSQLVWVILDEILSRLAEAFQDGQGFIVREGE